MENQTKNPSIACSVTSCANHCKSTDYCTLDCVRIGTHEANPTVPECVDCESFVPDKGCCSSKK